MLHDLCWIGLTSWLLWADDSIDSDILLSIRLGGWFVSSSAYSDEEKLLAREAVIQYSSRPLRTSSSYSFLFFSFSYYSNSLRLDDSSEWPGAGNTFSTLMSGRFCCSSNFFSSSDFQAAYPFSLAYAGITCSGKSGYRRSSGIDSSIFFLFRANFRPWRFLITGAGDTLEELVVFLKPRFFFGAGLLSFKGFSFLLTVFTVGAFEFYLIPLLWLLTGT